MVGGKSVENLLLERFSCRCNWSYNSTSINLQDVVAGSCPPGGGRSKAL